MWSSAITRYRWQNNGIFFYIWIYVQILADWSWPGSNILWWMIKTNIGYYVNLSHWTLSILFLQHFQHFQFYRYLTIDVLLYYWTTLCHFIPHNISQIFFQMLQFNTNFTFLLFIFHFTKGHIFPVIRSILS